MEKKAEVKVIPANAETVYIEHPSASYGIFCFNDRGDLFLNSDWGFYGFAWRHYGGGSFKDFLADTTPDYIVGKFEINYIEVVRKVKRIPPPRKGNVKVLVGCLIEHLKKELIASAQQQ